MLIINNKVNINREEEYKTIDSEYENNSKRYMNNSEMINSIVCNLNAKLFITNKSFSEINILDALPYRMHFMTSDNFDTPYELRHNTLANRINTIENIISGIRKQLANDKQCESKKNKYNQDILRFEAEITEILGKLTQINVAYKNHILHRTMIGVRCMFNEYINSYKAITYLRPILMNAAKLKSILQFKYEVSKYKMHDIFSIFIQKDYLENILNQNIKEKAEKDNTSLFQLDLFTTSRFFKFKMEDRFDDSNYNITNYKYNSNNTIDDSLKSINKLNAFLKDNMEIELLRHQKSNLLWMIALEDKIDYGTLVANSIRTDLSRAPNHRDDIQYYINSFKSKLPESFIKNYVIDVNNKQYILEINRDSSIARIMSIVSFLNIENLRDFGKTYHNHYSSYNSDVIEKIHKFEDFRNTKAINVPMCGGALCDEVGLGKTLSVISTLIVKMKHDMMKYSYYKSDMRELICRLDENISSDYTDPLDNGFEYNNLIIVPSRLTSQWETEITKYCADKFKLRVKVLVSINSIRQLEKELNDFYAKLANGKIANAEEFKNGGKNENKKDKNNNKITQKEAPLKNKYNTTVSQEPIIKIDKFSEIDIPIIEGINIKNEEIEFNEYKPANKTKPLSRTYANNKLTKEQKYIQKLMTDAKKQLENASKKKTYKTRNTSGENTSNVLDNDKIIKHSSGVSLDTVLQIQNPTPVRVVESKLLESAKLANKHKNQEELKTIKEIGVSENTLDNYQYILPYIESNETGEDYLQDQLYDVYIVSINLLSNENYLSYICHNEDNHLKPFIDSNNNTGNIKIHMAEKIMEDITGTRKICRITNKFNIFKIKWNRIILDEAHEKLNSYIKYFSTSIKQFASSGRHKLNYDEQFLFENLVALKANYKWALTGTPTQSGIDNIMGILQFLTKQNVYDLRKIEKIRYFSELLGMSSNELDSCLSEIFKKTLKKDVKNILNIPLFTEEVIYVDQTNIERNIYNTIRASRHFTEAVKLRRLFLMCTNILINEGYDFDSQNDIPSSTTSEEPITLEQLNANMIGCFTKQLNNITGQETRLNQAIDLLTKRLEQWRKIAEYIQALGLETKIAKAVLEEVRVHFGNLEKFGNRSNIELVYRLLDAFSAYRDPTSAGMVLYMNYENIKQELSKIWKASWQTEDAITWLAGQGSKLGVIKSNDEITKNRVKIQGMQTEKTRINNQIALFSNNEFLKDKTNDPCIICFEDLRDVIVTPCRHIFCLRCAKRMSNDLKTNFNCPECRTMITCDKLNITTVDIINSGLKPVSNDDECAREKENDNIKKCEEKDGVENKPEIKLTKLEERFGQDWKLKCTNKYGSKMTRLVEYLHALFDASTQNRVIIFSQYDKMLKMIGRTLDEFGVNYVYCHGNNFVLNKNIQKFKKDESIRVIMLSSETSNSGSNLTEANTIVLIEPLYHELQQVKAIEQQIIGRAVRLGQKLPVKIVRFITRGTIEDEHFQRNRYDMNTLQE
jgi:SNF2 family DNA or RNA helicase